MIKHHKKANRKKKLIFMSNALISAQFPLEEKMKNKKVSYQEF